jgi:hypothetical protein
MPEAKPSLLLPFLFMPVLLAVWFFNGTFYDQGDSVMHYLIAHGALTHPGLYVDHWGKPLFTLLASGFTTWGWSGMKLFNLLMIVGSGLTIFFIMQKLQPALAPVATLVFWLSPQVLLVSASGLTEPLFALTLTSALLAAVYQRHVLAAILCSMLPLIRTEGIVLMLIWMIFLFFSNNRKRIPWLLFGMLLISVAGFLCAGKSLFWLFTENPYPLKSINYGSGPWLHYFKNYLSLAGLPHYLLFGTGIIAWTVKLFRTAIRNRTHSEAIQLLILSLCLGYFFFHTFAWGTGLMGSFGMIRVLIAVMPLAAIIAAYGGAAIIRILPPRSRAPFAFVYAGWILLFPFTPSIYAIQSPLNRQPADPEKICLQAASFAGANDESGKTCFFFEAPLLTLGLKNNDPYAPPAIDYFDPEQRRSIRAYRNAVKGDVLIWDSWFSAIEAGISADLFDKETRKFKLTGTFGMPGSNSYFRIYRVIQ